MAGEIEVWEDFSILQPQDWQLPLNQYKHGYPGIVLNASGPYVFLALDEMVSRLVRETAHKYLTVDLKVHWLEEGEVPCIPDWHVDTKGEESRYHLFVTGHHALTEFEGYGTIPSCKWVSYSDAPHRGVPATESGYRLLLRVAEQNYTAPTKEPYHRGLWPHKYVYVPGQERWISLTRGGAVWSARRAHNPEDGGSNPSPATI